MEGYEEKKIRDDDEYERQLCSVPPTIKISTYTKVATELIRNPLYQKWRGTARGSIAEFLYGFTIRARMNNAIADMLLENYYKEKRLLVARFTMQGLATRLGYKNRAGIINHMKVLEEEGIFKVHIEPWKGRNLRVYEFGYWDIAGVDTYFEVLHMHNKFHKLLAEKKAHDHDL